MSVPPHCGVRPCLNTCKPEAQRPPLPALSKQEGGWAGHDVRHQKIYIYLSWSRGLEVRTLGEVPVTVWVLSGPWRGHWRETTAPGCLWCDRARVVDASPSQGLCRVRQTVPRGGDGKGAPQRRIREHG